MNQTSVIFAYLIIGFIVYITIKGELRSYLSIVGLSGTATTGRTGSW